MVDQPARQGLPARRGSVGRVAAWMSAPDAPHSELSGRVQRLAAVSVVALGLIWWFSRDVDDAGFAPAALLAGWVLMPAVLLLSLRAPRVKYGLAVPATLVSLACLWLALQARPSAGWMLVSAGILMGGAMGAWFWFRWAPIPAAFDDHRSAPRIALVATHVALVTAGILALALE